METAVMKCKLVEVNVLEAFGQTIEIQTVTIRDPFEFSEFLDIYLNHPETAHNGTQPIQTCLTC